MLGHLAWNRATADAISRLAPSSYASEVYTPDELEGLPAPVARYFRSVLLPGQPIVQAARIEHSGELRGSFEAAWAPFTSVQHISTAPAGFVWDARIQMAPLVAAHVRDTYLGGYGSMQGKVAGVITVVDQRGTPEMAASSLMRYLAEAAWYPTALLPSQGVLWEGIDDASARATLTDAGVTVSLIAHFSPGGEMTGVSTDRYRDVDGAGVLTPWGGAFRSYTEIDGMRIPTAGEVWWDLPEGRMTVWRGRIERATYSYRR